MNNISRLNTWNFGLCSSLFRFGKLPAGLGRVLLQLGLLMAPVAISSAALGAERIYIYYGPIEFSLPIAALDTYAREGKIEQVLAAYTNYLTPEQLEQLREVLVARVDVTPVAIAQFLYSPQGIIILERLSEVIQTKAGQPGFYAIRAALIKAAAHPEGLTILNVLREFPTYGIRINSARGFAIIDDLSNLIRQSEMAIAVVQQQARAEAAAETEFSFAGQPGVAFSLEQDLRQPGLIPYRMQTLRITDIRRNRTFLVDLYLPTPSNPLPGEGAGGAAPVIVISHGLGSDRQTFAYLARHLASYGFAVAVPEHPGSNATQIQALIDGLASEAAPPSEFINRPLDVKVLLDELQRLFGNQLDLERVGVLGQSFGGYTALALAGASINFEQLQKDCARLNDSLNLSLLLQCRAEELAITEDNLQDERVKGAIAINPVGSSLFGETEFGNIKVPMMLIAGSDDTVAPALPEQIQPFTWLTTPNKYLVLVENGTHFSVLEESSGSVPVPSSVIGPEPALAREYIQALSVAFFKTYTANNSEYRPYLSASYAEYLTQLPIPLSLVQSLTLEQLSQSSEGEDSTPEPVPSPLP
ncbi:MAG: alpha/beta hydrolase [Coleofasciculus sp. S288]|nr:alpha/beta hydrolase [Coleofasciculus sp. S288]